MDNSFPFPFLFHFLFRVKEPLCNRGSYKTGAQRFFHMLR